METKFAEVAHLYIGCDVQIQVNAKFVIDRFIAFHEGANYNPNAKPIFLLKNGFKKTQQVKPVLRQLSDITEEERDRIFSFEKNYENLKFIESLLVDAKITVLLLSWHIDIFNLIPSGQAIDKTKI